MQYELQIELDWQTLFSNFSHNRDGLLDALCRIASYKDKKDFVSAKITSERDGLVLKIN